MCLYVFFLISPRKMLRVSYSKIRVYVSQVFSNLPHPGSLVDLNMIVFAAQILPEKRKLKECETNHGEIKKNTYKHIVLHVF